MSTEPSSATSGIARPLHESATHSRGAVSCIMLPNPNGGRAARERVDSIRALITHRGGEQLMRFGFAAGAALLVIGLAGRPASAAPAASGDYIEARSCNVYAGAC